MKYYIFEHGTMKLDGIELSAVVIPKLIEGFTEVSKTKFYKIRAQENSKKAVEKTKAIFEATKKKACNVKDALKN